MPPFEVQITVSGRVGGTLIESAFADLATEVTPRHTIVRVGSDQVDDVVRLLQALQHRDVAFDRVTSATCTRSG